MPTLLEVKGAEQAVYLVGIRLAGVTGENLTKLLVTIIFAAAVVLLMKLLRRGNELLWGERESRARFWTKQGIQVFGAVLVVVGLVSLWFDDPARLATGLGFVTAGLAFALQKVVTAVAGYVIILRGKTFNIGDRIVMGGVRGDVIALGFTQTTIMEMGQPPPVNSAEPPVWVGSRQYTGRIVTVSNSKIFDEPIYNYTSEFPYLWEELKLPVSYKAKYLKIERILLEAAARHTVDIAQLSEAALRELERRYLVKREELSPQVYYRLTDNWLELAVRFVVQDHGIRQVKNKISRDVLAGLSEIGEGVASATFEIVGVPPLRVEAVTGERVKAPGT